MSRWLFVKRRFDWPRARGHDLHTYGMMRALAEQGHAVAVLTLEASAEEALAGIDYAGRYCIEGSATGCRIPSPLGGEGRFNARTRG